MKKELTAEQMEQRKKKNKRTLKIALPILAILLLVSIFGDSEPKAKTETVETPVAVAPEPEPEQPNKSYDLDEVSRFIEGAFYAVLSEAADDGGAKLKKERPFVVSVTDIEIRNNKAQRMSAQLFYESDFAMMSELFSSTVVQAMLVWLMAEGYDPAADWSSVSCHAYTPTIGATGKRMLKAWGYSSYNFNTDSIVWTPAKK